MDKFNAQEYKNQWNRDHYKQYSIRLNKEKDSDIIEHIENQSEITNYIKSLILKDMKGAK